MFPHNLTAWALAIIALEFVGQVVWSIDFSVELKVFELAIDDNHRKRPDWQNLTKKDTIFQTDQKDKKIH